MCVFSVYVCVCCVCGVLYVHVCVHVLLSQFKDMLSIKFSLFSFKKFFCKIFYVR